MATIGTNMTVTGNTTVTARHQYQGIGLQGHYGWWQNNIAYSFDFSVRYIGAGAVWWCSASYNHSGQSYGCGNEAWYTKYSGAHSAHYVLHNYQTGQGGHVGFTTPSTYQIRCTKNAGYYPGQGGSVVQLVGPI
jgi:hypothetical protein